MMRNGWLCLLIGLALGVASSWLYQQQQK